MEAVLPRAVHICTTPNYSGTWKGANVKLLIAAVKCKWCSAERVVIAGGGGPYTLCGTHFLLCALEGSVHRQSTSV